MTILPVLALGQDAKQQWTRPVEVITLAIEGPQPYAVAWNSRIALPVTDASDRQLRSARGVYVRIFAGSRKELIRAAQSRNPLPVREHDCIRFEGFHSAPGRLNHQLAVDKGIDASFTDFSQESLRPQVWTLVVTKETDPRSRDNYYVWVHKDSVAQFFGAGVEIVVEPPAAVRSPIQLVSLGGVPFARVADITAKRTSDDDRHLRLRECLRVTGGAGQTTIAFARGCLRDAD